MIVLKNSPLQLYSVQFYKLKPQSNYSALICADLSCLRYMMGQYVTVHGEVISHVNISRTIVEDGGLYTCVASNRAGTADHSARLNIYGEKMN